MMGSKYVCVWLVSVWLRLAAAVPRAAHGELRLFAAASYDVESTVLLNDVARNDKEVGYKILATLDVAPVWANQQTEFVLRFQLRSPKLYLRGKHVLSEFMPYDSVWDSYPDSTFYAHWKNGIIQAAYLDPEELVDVVNYKKSLASLFQFQVLDGEYNETDVSGPCTVLYETISMNVFRKIKRRCAAESGGAVAEARRVARYTLGAALDALDALYADELLALGHAQLGLKARAFTRLQRRAGAPPPPPPAPAAPDAAAALRSLPAALKPLPLTLAPPAADADEELLDDEALVGELATMGAALEEGAGEGGAAEAGAALLRALPTLRAAGTARLAALLARPDLHPHLEALCRALGAAGTRAAHAAVREFLALDSREPLLALAHVYLGALALAPRADDGAVLDVLRLGDEARAPALAESALLAASAAAAARSADLGQTVRDTLARSLARCKEERCRAVRLAALGNLRRGDTADLLLEHAARWDGGAAALAAVDALGAAPPAALTFARLDRLTAVALDERAPLELRGAALDLLVARRAAVPAPLARVAHTLHVRGPHELRRVLWQRMASLAPRHDELRRLPAMLEPLLRGWDAHAHNGTSSVLVRATGWEGGGWSAALDSVQLARAGLLRRGVVTLRAERAGGADSVDALTVRVWTRGLEAFSGAAGAGEGGEGEGEAAAGGLALSVGGARLRDIPLFEGQAELLGHVWAGTASEPTAVLRALQPLALQQGAVPLCAGAVLRAHSGAALALALDASAQVSLWYRSARAELSLRAGALLAVGARLGPAWGSLQARAESRAAPRLRIGADLDFYSGVALCVRARTDAYERRRNVTLQSLQAERRLRVRRERVEAWPVGGRTLALGRPNDVTCCTLRAADTDD